MRAKNKNSVYHTAAQKKRVLHSSDELFLIVPAQKMKKNLVNIQINQSFSNISFEEYAL